eukprot:GILK01000332.1.p1 GENE.GILK01000332.1~~GILK01000332.1.p1  ORF type:complete len:540 (-),score=121.83 GILK01000332.1:333-1925(-)
MATKKLALCAFALLFASLACVSANNVDCIVDWEENHHGNRNHYALFSENHVGALAIGDSNNKFTNIHFRMFVTKQKPWHVKFMYYTPRSKFMSVLPSFLKKKLTCTTVTIDAQSLALYGDTNNILSFNVDGNVYKLKVHKDHFMSEDMFTNALAYRKQPLPGALVASRLLADTSLESRMAIGKILGVVFPKPLEEFSATTQNDHFHSMDLLLNPVLNRLKYDANNKFFTELSLETYIKDLRLPYLQDSPKYIELLKKVVENEKFAVAGFGLTVAAHVAERFLEIHGPLLYWNLESSQSVSSVVLQIITNLRERPAAIGLLRSVSRFIFHVNQNELTVSLFRGLIEPLTSDLLDALVFPRDRLSAVERTAVRHVVKRFVHAEFDPEARPDLSDLPSEQSDMSEPDAVFACFEPFDKGALQRALQVVGDVKRLGGTSTEQSVYIPLPVTKLRRRVRPESLPADFTFVPLPDSFEMQLPSTFDTSEQSSGLRTESTSEPAAESSLRDTESGSEPSVELPKSVSDPSLDALSSE